MGYTTQFEGSLKFKNELSLPMLKKLNEIIINQDNSFPGYINFEIEKDFSGIIHNNDEKSYEVVEQVNHIIGMMKIDFPEFELAGELLAQGEEIGDIWRLVIENGKAIEKAISLDQSSFQPLNIVNPESLNMGEVFGINPDRLNKIAAGLNEMVKIAESGDNRMIYMSGIVRYIESLCETKEEFFWAWTNHINWMMRHNRALWTMEQQQEFIKKYGQPKHL